MSKPEFPMKVYFKINNARVFVKTIHKPQKPPKQRACTQLVVARKESNNDGVKQETETTEECDDCVIIEEKSGPAAPIMMFAHSYTHCLDKNKGGCAKCYCEICDVPTAECLHWTSQHKELHNELGFSYYLRTFVMETKQPLTLSNKLSETASYMIMTLKRLSFKHNSSQKLLILVNDTTHFIGDSQWVDNMCFFLSHNGAVSYYLESNGLNESSKMSGCEFLENHQLKMTTRMHFHAYIFNMIIRKKVTSTTAPDRQFIKCMEDPVRSPKWFQYVLMVFTELTFNDNDLDSLLFLISPCCKICSHDHCKLMLEVFSASRVVPYLFKSGITKLMVMVEFIARPFRENTSTFHLAILNGLVGSKQRQLLIDCLYVMRCNHYGGAWLDSWVASKLIPVGCS